MHAADLLDTALAEIGRDRLGLRERHARLSRERGTYVANGFVRTLSAVYRYAAKVHPDLPGNPCDAVDFNPEQPRQDVVADLTAWWAKVQALENPVRRDLQLYMLLTGQRRTAACVGRVEHLDLERGFQHVPCPKGGERRAFMLPLSPFVVDLIRRRLAGNGELFGQTCPWLFPSITASSGHVEEPKEAGLPCPHTLRRTFATACAAVGLTEFDTALLLNHKLPGI